MGDGERRGETGRNRDVPTQFLENSCARFHLISSGSWKLRDSLPSVISYGFMPPVLGNNTTLIKLLPSQ